MLQLFVQQVFLYIQNLRKCLDGKIVLSKSSRYRTVISSVLFFKVQASAIFEFTIAL